MRKHYLSIAMIAAMALASCGTENDDVQVLPADGDKTVETPATDNKEQITFKAVYSNGDGISKTAIEDRTNLVFTAGDEINVFDGTDASVFKGDISAPSATCNFTGTADPDAQTYYAVYPSSASLDASSVSAEIPVAQDAEAGTFDKNAHVMMASASGAKKEFKFKTANAFIRITAPRNLKSVVMTGNNDEKIAGNITVSGYSDITVSGATATSITLSNSDIMEKGKEYYISYAPAKFENGITLTLTDENGNEGTYTTNKFESKPNQVNNIKAEKLGETFYANYVSKSCEELSDYLASFTGEVAEVILTNYNASTVKTALTNNSTQKVKLVLPESVKRIYSHEFWLNSKLISIEMPGVTSIDAEAFWECSSIEFISAPNCTSIGEMAFYKCTNLVSIDMPNLTNSIGKRAFYKCSNLTLTSLPNGVTSIEVEAFNGCTSLALTSLPENLSSIGNYAFSNCTSLAITSLPETLTNIGDKAFSNCTSLKQITIPSKVESLGNGAFIDCSNLKSITILGNPTIGDASEKNDFNKNPYATVNVSKESYERYSDYWDYCKRITYLQLNILD